jgi:acyl carrier protein
MRDPDEIRLTIRAYVLEHFPAARERDVSDSDSLLDSGIIDSLGVLDVVAFLESAFHLTIADEELEVDDFASIDALTAFVCRRSRCISSP